MKRPSRSTALLASLAATLLACAAPRSAAQPASAPTPTGQAATSTPAASTPSLARTFPPEEAVPACTRGEADACRRLAARMLGGISREEASRYTEAFRTACKPGGPADACAGLGLAEGIGAGVPKDDAASMARMEQACASGSSVACAARAEAVWRNEDVKPEEKARMLKEATGQCEKLGGSVCYSVASAHEMGWGTQKDPARAGALSRKACETGSAFACFSEGGSLMQRDGEAGAPAALAFFEKACAGDVARGCGAVAQVLLSGMGVPKDPARGLAMMQRTCALDEPQACDYLAASNEGRATGEDGKPAFADDAEEERVAEKYCALGGAEACSTVAFGRGGRAEKSGQLEDMEGVLVLLQKGCRRGSMRGCNVLGHVAKDALRACDKGNAGQCLVAGFVHLQGTSMPPINGPSFPVDAQKAREAFQKACDGGRQSACARARAP